MKKTLSIFALFALATQAYAAPSLERGAVVCNDVNSVRKAHQVAMAGAQLPAECTKTLAPVALHSASDVGQLTRIQVHQGGQVTEKWTLQSYVRN